MHPNTTDRIVFPRISRGNNQLHSRHIHIKKRCAPDTLNICKAGYGIILANARKWLLFKCIDPVIHKIVYFWKLNKRSKSLYCRIIIKNRARHLS